MENKNWTPTKQEQLAFKSYVAKKLCKQSTQFISRKLLTGLWKPMYVIEMNAIQYISRIDLLGRGTL